MQTGRTFAIECIVFAGIAGWSRRQPAVKSFQYWPTVVKAAFGSSSAPSIPYAMFLTKSFKDARSYGEEPGFSSANLFSKGLERDGIRPPRYADYNLLVPQLYLSKISFLYL